MLILTFTLFLNREKHEKIHQYDEMLLRKSDCEFFKYVRVTKETFHQLVNRLETTEHFSSMRSASQGPAPTSASTALAATLWYLGNLNSQRDIAERFNISQGHLCTLIKDVVDYLCSIAQQVICWPATSEIDQLEFDFAQYSNFPGIIGAIDGCHIPILAPDYCQLDYLDRNHRHSVNLLAVCDARKRFTYCFAGYPGSVHDQRVLSNSSLGDIINTHPCTYFPSSHYHIIGDSAFQLHPCVMVPYKDTGNLTVKEMTYNRRLSQTRRVIENTFGLLKGRFRRLKHLECKLSRVSSNILACCVIHNLTVSEESEVESLLNDVCVSAADDGGSLTPAPAAGPAGTAGKQKRDMIAQNVTQNL